MYEEFYGLKEKPFSRTPDPRFLYQSRKHAEALARLQLAVEDMDLVLLTGDIGCGKTTLSRALIDGFDGRYHPLLIINPRLSPIQLLQTVALRLGIDEEHTRQGVLEGINAKLFELYEMGKRTVLIIDEAQLIASKETFEEIRLLTNFQLDDRNLLAVVLIGQTELKTRLAKRPYRALRQRIGLQYHLGPLDEAETREYVVHRLSVAGREAPLFDEEAIAALYYYSDGIPRLINVLAGNALLEGFGREAAVITGEIVENVAEELR